MHKSVAQVHLVLVFAERLHSCTIWVHTALTLLHIASRLEHK